MSQHLINDFIHKNVVFKSFHGGRIVNKKLVKYQASNRKNNNSPEDVAESIQELKPVSESEVDSDLNSNETNSIDESNHDNFNEVVDSKDKEGSGNGTKDQSNDELGHIDIIV